ncbi:MAG TPA: PilT/PilU family type 4a pilus ATPase [Oligoflexus sp.]|uniref:type IV pilus twitching motility protein PilT n=1 Tax=Oligoflexus sp. TaxID=1971216 RepID=UPI002D6CE283|nr:PilT/PilU family type 4a pilus ATPase [Oligoflexus sp.]HYX34845.1 PilT/PilU family type 4a pilus ATPase [Oligoflexus sp.]
MENFKKALKQAILDKAEAVRFEEAQKPQLMMFAVERPVAPLPEQTRQEILQLIESLLPMSQPTSAPVREGVLSIVNFGELKLIASTGDVARLFAFIPPQGNQMYQQIKNQLLNQSLKPVPKPIAMEEASPFARSEQPGHFAMATVTGQGSTESFAGTPAAKPEEPALPPSVIGLTVPPLPKATAGDTGATVVKPRFDKPIPVDFASDPGPDADSDPLKAPEPAQNTVISAHVPEALQPAMTPPGFQKEEYTDAEDYHFNQSVHSLSRGPSEFTNTYAAIHLPVAGPAPHAVEAMESNIPPRKAPDDQPVIHFGASIPGETIERTGRLPIDTILEEMVSKRASDLHLTLGEPACVRIDGEIVRMGSGALTEDVVRSYLLPIMPPKNREEFARICDTDFSYEVPGLARFRVNVFRNRMGVGAVLRQIPDKILSADELGLPAAVRKLCELHKGLVVVTGPTGSGKSTTLASMVDLINESRNEHILTIEDPIEFVHKQKRCLINQREVHKHTQSFSRALRAALREDPDIILIGEMRDLETVEIAIETAETGHLVFGTLHTNTAISTVDRLVDQFPADQQEQVRVMLAESLKGVVAQTLVKKKGGGRVAAQEILIVDKAVSSLIREGNTHMVQNHMQTQKAKGNCTLNDALIALVSKGIVDPRDAYAKAVEKDAFANMLQQKGITLDPSVKTA